MERKTKVGAMPTWYRITFMCC